MKPETVLALENGDDPKEKLQVWLDGYRALGEECPCANDIIDMLSCRAQKACELIAERKSSEPDLSSHDDMYYVELAKLRDDEDASLDGDFPLGNENDASFAGNYFSVPELIKIQCGEHRLIFAGNFSGYNFDVLVKKGFIAELDGDYAKAADCYGGVSTSGNVQDREYDCRLKAAAKGGNADSAWKAAMLCKEQNKPYEAAMWFKMAVELGSGDALLSAARVYLDEKGDFYNKRLAEEYLNRAADVGSAKAMILLGDLELLDTDIPFWQQAAYLKDLEFPDEKPKRKIKKQHKKQMERYRLAANTGDCDAMGALSMACHLGYPEKRDDEQAFLWASRAADSGDGSAMYQTAYFYENGFGTNRDIEAAMLLYIEAAEKGVRSAAVRLYEIYTKGLGTIRPDGKKAAHYLFLSGNSETEDDESEA